SHQARRRKERDCGNPKRNARTLSGPRGRYSAQRRVTGPTPQWRTGRYKQSREDDNARKQKHPVRERVQKRERHVASANLKRDQEVSEAARQNRCKQKEHHDYSIHETIMVFFLFTAVLKIGL